MCRNFTDKQFQPLVELSSKLVEWTLDSRQSTEKLLQLLNIHPKKGIESEDLKLVLQMLRQIAQLLSFIATLQNKTIIEVKEMSFYALYSPFSISLRTWKEALPVISDRFRNLEQSLEQSKEIELQVPEAIQKELQEWLTERQQLKEALKKYIR